MGVETRIAVVGMAGRFPGAPDVDAFWRLIRDGGSGLTRFSEAELRAAGVPEARRRDPSYVPVGGVIEGAERFDAERFGMTAREAERTDPQHRVFLECALAALEDAGRAGRDASQLVGVFAGAGSAPTPAGDVQRALGHEKDFLATRVSYKLDLRGPSVTVQTACSTALVAVALACQSLLAFQCDTALAGAVALGHPRRAGYLHTPGMALSPDGRCQPFDADAAGTVPGDGAGVVVLRRLDDALADGDTVLAVIAGAGVTNDGAARQSFSAPGVEGQRGAITQALAMADFDPATVSYVEAHGTGTALGDPIEVAALADAFGEGAPRGACAIGSVKASIGHLDAAAGVAGLIKVVQMLRHRELPASPYFRQPNPRLALDTTPFVVHRERRDWRSDGPRRAGVSAFGIGGTNAHLAVEEAPPPPPPTPSAQPHLLLLSAATETALSAAAAALDAHLDAHPGESLADVAFTLQVGRTALRHRRAIVCTGHAQARRALATPAAGAVVDGGREVVFLFPGHGSARPGMARPLSEAFPSFRDDVERGLACLDRLGDALRPALLSAEHDPSVLADAALGQPAIFLVEWALARLLLSWGIRPAAMVGHSLGEYAAACVAGALSVEDALRLVARRGALIARTPPGAMLAVALDPDALSGSLDPTLSLAAVNGPSRSVVAGPAARVEALERELSARGVRCRSLGVPHAFHSPLMDDLVAPLVAAARGVTLRAPTTPVISCVDGQPLGATDAAWWGRHLREPVLFDAALQRACEVPGRVLVEVGPGDALTTLARRHGALRGHDALATLRDGASLEPLLDAVGRLWTHGVPVDLARLHPGPRRRVRLPAYPFERRRYVDEADASDAPARDLAGLVHRPVWGLAPIEPRERLPEGELLVFADDHPLAAELARLHARTTLVRAGERFERTSDRDFSLRPEAPSDYDALVDALEHDGRLPEHVIHLGGAAHAHRPLDAEIDRGLLGATRLLRALGPKRTERAMGLLLVTRGAQPAGGARVEHPARAMAFALPRVVPDELPQIRCGAVDIDASTSAHALLDELGALGREPVALRSTGRYALRVEPAPVEAAPPMSPPRGACVITGGLGGVGLALARRIARTRGARLALLGRHGVPPRACWDAIAAHGTDDPDSLGARLRALLDLEAAGAEVMVLSADLTKPDEVARALDAVRARYGTIEAVVHAAGVASGGALLRQPEEEVRAALAPKVQAAATLAELTRPDALSYFVLCSSLTALAGGFGQLAYTAANQHLDALAHALRDRGVRAVSINWDGWREVGMAARATRTTPPSVAHPLLGARAHAGASLVVHRRRLDPSRDWELAEHRVLGRPTLPGTAFLSWAYAAASERFGVPTVALRDLTLLTPLVADHPVELWTLVRQDGSLASIEFHGRVVGSAEPPQLHARCAASVIDGPPGAFDPPEDHGDERSPDAVFAERAGWIDLGPRWRCLTRLAQDATGGSAELVAPDDGAALDPAVLDQGLGCAAHLCPRGSLPHAFGAVRVYAPLRGRVFARSRLVDRGARSARLSAQLWDAQGALCVEVDDYLLLAPRAPTEFA